MTARHIDMVLENASVMLQGALVHLNDLGEDAPADVLMARDLVAEAWALLAPDTSVR